MTTAEVHKKTGISRETLSRWARKRGLPKVPIQQAGGRIGRAGYRWTPDDVKAIEDWWAGRKT